MDLYKTFWPPLIWLTLLAAIPLVSFAEQKTARPESMTFIDAMTEKHGFDRQSLIELFGKADVKTSILKAIRSPYEAKPWHQYRKIFVTDTRIRKGLAFWQDNEPVLKATAQRYGVPPEIIVAIIGVETQYGSNTGPFRVLDSLFTLAFEYPKRSQYFRRELEQFLLLCREENLDPTVPKGSYAGAMGVPQFMPSSFRHYAVDFDQDNQRDIWSNHSDSIASVANYFSKHGWQEGEPVTYPVEVNGTQIGSTLEKGLKPNRTIQNLQQLGVRLPQPIIPDKKARLLKFEELDGASFWVGMHNFYVITRYNHSAPYAMAVYQLSQKILAQRNKIKAPA